jgi:MtN3 and saliva related transmembrane protein
MNIDISEIIGLAAGGLTTVSFLPQVVKTWKSKSAKDLSLVMFSLFCLGIVLWLVYGLLINSLPVILSNAFTLILSSTILFFKLKFKD